MTSTTATDRTGTGEDLERTLHLAAPAEDVLAALRTPGAVSAWWSPATGSAEPGGTLEVSARSGASMVSLRVEPSEANRVVWSVVECPLQPEWDGTTIVFEVEAAHEGSTLRFCHHGLTPRCECFDMCEDGWARALGHLVAFAETGQGAADGDSFRYRQDVAAPAEAVLAALGTTEAVASWWGPAAGSADPGGTLEVSFLGGRQRIVLLVEPALTGRVAWRVRECPLTPEWIGTTIFFGVEEAGDGATLFFRHEGLTPRLECFDMCHEGWTHYLGSLVSYVETGAGRPYTEEEG